MCMPPKKTSTRLDITLPDTLVKKIRAHADERGITVSGLIGEAVRSYLDGGNAPSSSGPVTLSPGIEALIQERVKLAVEETLSRVTVSAPPAPGTPHEPAKKRVTSGGGKAEVPDDIRAQMQKHTAGTLENAIKTVCNPDNNPDIKTVNRGTLYGFVKGTATTTKAEYLEQIKLGLEYLERLDSVKQDTGSLSYYTH